MRKNVDSPFAKNLKSVMAERSLSVKTVAEISGSSSSVVHDWLNGTIPHDLKAVAKIANALKVDFQWLLTGMHSQGNLGELSLSEVFDVEADPSFSGVFILEAKRLRRKGKE